MSPLSRDLLTSHALHHGLRPSAVLRPAAAVERHTLPLDEALTSVIGAGMARGRTIACSGDAALALALRVVGRATQEGAWLAVVGIDDLGLAAAAEQGVALQRTVLVAPPRATREWAATLATAIDGFALLMTHVPHGVTVGEARKVVARVQARQGVMVLVDPARQPAVASAFQPDITLHTTTLEWFGIGAGVGHVQGRDVRIDVGGRRMPGAATHTVRLGC